MNKTKITALMLSAFILAAGAVGCDDISLTNISDVEKTSQSDEKSDDSEKETEENSDSESETGESETGEAETDAEGGYESSSALESALGFKTYEIEDAAYEAVSYKKADDNTAEVTYNHDGNTAVLKISDTEQTNLSGLTGTESADTFNLSDYDLDINVQENDGGYFAEWSAVAADGELRFFSLSEENVDLAVFENTLTSFAQTAISDDQESYVSNDSDSDEETDGEDSDSSADADAESEGEVIATFANNLEVFSMKIESDGTYKFTDPVSDAQTWWDIYVLDSEFEDGVRYIMQEYSPEGSTPTTLELKEGQYVYAFCNKNSWTSGDAVDCKLTVTKF